MNIRPFAAALTLTLTACAGPAATSSESVASAPTTMPALELPADGAATNLVVRAAACWLGGMWGDVRGEAEGDRRGATRDRCADVAQLALDVRNDVTLERLRALDEAVVHPLRVRILALASQDPSDRVRVDSVAVLFDATVATAREAMAARRAGDRVLRDLAAPADRARLPTDEADAIRTLRRTDALRSLDAMQTEDLRHDGHALALLFALDRVDASRRLPLHLKPYACGPIYEMAFGAPLPPLPEDASSALPPGRWLAYVETSAAAAGHPVADGTPPAHALTLANAELAAAFADQLQDDVEEIDDATLRPIVEDAAARLRSIAHAALE